MTPTRSHPFASTRWSLLQSVILGVAILCTASAASGSKKLFVGGLSWNGAGGAPRMKVRPLQDRVLVKRADGSGGSTSAEAYVETARGSGSVIPLPNPHGTTDSGAFGIDCEDGSDLCIASGSVENTSGDPQPILWKCTTSACTSWTTTLLPLPSGHTSGEASCVYIPQPSGFSSAAAVGWTSDSSGVAKAVAWLPNLTGGFDVDLLPELGSLPTPPKASFGSCIREAKTMLTVTGSAENDSGQSRPVAWYYDAGLTTWTLPVTLPLPVGSTAGAATALTVASGTPGAEVITLAAVAEIDDAGTPGTEAYYAQCTTTTNPSSDCGSAMSWNSTSLVPLPGHGSSSAGDVNVLAGGYAMLAGTSYPSSTDPYTSGEATLWIVDTSTHTLISTLRVSDMAYDLVPGDAPRVITSIRTSPGDGLAVYAVSGTELGGSLHWLMTEVPWNRRVDEIVVVPAGGQTFDVEVRWRIDLAGGVSGDTELGAQVGLEINTVPETPTDSPECLIWDIKDGDGYQCAALPDGASCGTATLNTLPVSLTCDGDNETCGLGFTTAFSGLSLSPGDTIEGTLTALSTAEAETVLDDDSLLFPGFIAVPALDATGLSKLGLLILSSGCLMIGTTAFRRRF